MIYGPCHEGRCSCAYCAYGPLGSNFFRIFNCSTTLKELNLSGSGIVTIPTCIKRFVALKSLNLHNCKQLRKILAFPQNAVLLYAEGCMSLDLNNKCWLPELPGLGPVCIDINIEKFQSMTILDFSLCEFLKIISDLSKIPNLSFLISLKLRSLKDLDLNGCSRINHFPEIECEMKYLESIDFGGTGIKKLPSSIRYLIGLSTLELEDCINLTNLPSSIYELQHLMVLNLRGCSKLVKFAEKMGDSGQSMLPPTNSSVFNDGCSLIVFPALGRLNLRAYVLLESDFFRIFNSSSTLEVLDLSWSGIVTIPACIKRFVALKSLNLYNCKQLREIQAFPPSSICVNAKECMSLDLYNKCWLPELPSQGPVGSGIELEFLEIRFYTGSTIVKRFQIVIPVK